MKEGMYRFDYKGPDGSDGWGILVFDSGKVWGIDISNAHYDGDYEFNQNTRVIDATIKATYPKGTELVTGDIVTEDQVIVEFDVSLPKEMNETSTLTVKLFGQDVMVVFRKVRDAPTVYS